MTVCVHDNTAGIMVDEDGVMVFINLWMHRKGCRCMLVFGQVSPEYNYGMSQRLVLNPCCEEHEQMMETLHKDLQELAREMVRVNGQDYEQPLNETARTLREHFEMVEALSLGVNKDLML